MNHNGQNRPHCIMWTILLFDEKESGGYQQTHF